MNLFKTFKDFLSESKEVDERFVYTLPDKSKQFLLKRTADDLDAIASEFEFGDDEINVSELDDIIKTIQSIKKSVKKIKESAVNEQHYAKGCVMAQLDADSLKEYLPAIPEDELYTENDGKDFGMETEPHVTALYGLHSEEFEDSEVEEIVKKYENIDISLTDISMFENDKYDVLKFGVKSKALNKMNEELTKLPHSTDYPDYNPHATIAYLKKGEAKKYLEKFDEPIELTSKVVEYSKPGDDSDPKRKVYYKLDEGYFWPKSKLSQTFEMLLADTLNTGFRGGWYVDGYDLYRKGDKKPVLTIDPDKDSVDSIVQKLKKKGIK